MLKILQMIKSEHMTLHLILKILQNNYKLKLLTLHHKNNLCLHIKQQKNQHIKNIAHFVIEQITPSLLVSKNNEMMKINEMLMLDQNLHKTHLYITFVLLLMTKQNEIIHILEVEVLHGTTLRTNIIHKTDIALHPVIDLVMTKILLRHNTLDHDKIIINETQDPIVLLTDLLIDRLTDTTLVPDLDHAHIQETIKILQNLQLHTNHLQDQEILDFLDPVHTQILEIKSK